MDDRQPARLPIAAPEVPPPPPFVERRVASRREVDRVAHDERALLARALDVLAADGSPEEHLAGLLDLLAEKVGAVRAAVVADGPAPRVAVAASGPSDRDAAIALARWLDSAAPRSRAQRAAAKRAPISVAIRATAAGTVAAPATGPSVVPPDATLAPDLTYACLPIPSVGEVTLGFAFIQPVDAATLALRLPPALARHAAVALTLVTDALATERELASLRATDAERGRFIATVAHELRTPLTGLSGYLDLILDGRVRDPEVEREFMERGRTIVGSMGALVDDLLELSRLESGTLVLELGPFSVADALNAVSAGLLPIALDRGVRLQVTAPPRLRSATGDRRRVEQIVTNLVANAIKFAGDRPVEVTGLFEGPIAVIAVRDEGAGIAPDDIERVFERFYRIPDHERVAGTGLGLPIARDLARAMGGELGVTSMPGVGSSFVLILPGPAGAIPRPAITAAFTATLALETERLRTLAMLRAGAAATGSGRVRSHRRDPADRDGADDRGHDDGPYHPAGRDTHPAEVGR